MNAHQRRIRRRRLARNVVIHRTPDSAEYRRFCEAIDAQLHDFRTFIRHMPGRECMRILRRTDSSVPDYSHEVIRSAQDLVTL